MVKLTGIVPSKTMTKRFTAEFEDGTRVNFGARGGSTYIDHHDKKKQINYLARHKATGMEDWNDPKTAGALARWLLWEKPSLTEAIYAFKKRFGV